MSQPLRRDPNLRKAAKVLRGHVSKLGDRKLRTAARRHLVTVLKESPECKWFRGTYRANGYVFNFGDLNFYSAFAWQQARAPHAGADSMKNFFFWQEVANACYPSGLHPRVLK